MSEGIQSRVKMLVSVSCAQSAGGCLRAPRLTEVSQISVEAELRRGDVTKKAPERLDGEGTEVNLLRYKQFSTSTINFGSEYYETKMSMVAVEFLTSSVCQTVLKESSCIPKFKLNSKEQVKKDAEVFKDEFKEEGAVLGWI